MHHAAGIDKVYWLRNSKVPDSMFSITVRGTIMMNMKTDYFPISHITWWGFYTMKLKMSEK